MKEALGFNRLNENIAVFLFNLESKFSAVPCSLISS